MSQQEMEVVGQPGTSHECSWQWRQWLVLDAEEQRESGEVWSRERVLQMSSEW